jgi:uncharacterized protein (TIGR03118 family)
VRNLIRIVRDIFRRSSSPPMPAPRRLVLECLEEREVPSATVLQTNLISDLPGVAMFQDPHLVNPWGISESATSAFWISDNGAGVSTLYNTAGVPQSLVVSIPTPDASAGGAPTGTVFNIALASRAFTVSANGRSAPAVFLFATEDGTISGWAPSVDPTHAIIAVDNSDEGAIYKGLAIATDAGGRTLLYATDFHNGRVDVFDTTFKPATGLASDAFTDPDLPKGYAPFNVEVLNGKVYVTYARQDAAAEDDVAGKGRGFVDVYNLDGSGGQRLVSRGELNAPWGLAIAPASFGSLAGALLVGNFGDGKINAYNPTTGEFLGALEDPDGEPIQIDGLWALKVGNGGNGGDANSVYFTAGLDDEQHGLFGSLKPVAPGTDEGPAEEQRVQAALDIFEIELSHVRFDLSSGASQEVLRHAVRDLESALVDLARAEIRFALDERADLRASGEQAHGRLQDFFVGDLSDLRQQWQLLYQDLKDNGVNLHVGLGVFESLDDSGNNGFNG